MSNETKSKEDVLDEVVSRDHPAKHSSYDKNLDYFDGKCSHVFGAMDDWAKIMGVEFLIWFQRNNFKKVVVEKNEYYQTSGQSKYTIDQLYDWFISQQKQKAHE